MKVFISSDNIHQLAKVQSANQFSSRDVVILWDELSQKERNIAENIDVEVEVHTSDPSSVPDKWSDNIVQESDGLGHLDMVKNIISNPDRETVYEMLLDEDPPEPLILWWISHTIPDQEYMKKVADACHYGLFQSDTKYLWGALAYGVEAGVGKFSWPESSEEAVPDSEQELFDDLIEEYGFRKKELRLAWGDVGNFAEEWAGGGSAENDEGVGGGEDDKDRSQRDRGQSSLLDV